MATSARNQDVDTLLDQLEAKLKTNPQDVDWLVVAGTVACEHRSDSRERATHTSAPTI